MNTRQLQEFHISIPHKAGEGAAVLADLARAGVDLCGFIGYAAGPDKAFLHFVSDNADALRNALSGREFTTGEVLAVDIEPTPGACAGVLQKLAEAGIDVEHCYATSNGDTARVILRVADAARARNVLEA